MHDVKIFAVNAYDVKTCDSPRLAAEYDRHHRTDDDVVVIGKCLVRRHYLKAGDRLTSVSFVLPE